MPRFVLLVSGLVVSLAGCTPARGGSVVDASTTTVTCQTDFRCEDGVCTCLSGSTSGTACCHPDDCPGSASACDRICEACVGRPDAASADEDAGHVVPTDAGQPTIRTCTLAIDPCAAECITDGDSSSYCASQCGTNTYGCYQVCLARSDSSSYCASICGTESDDAQAGCGEVCLARSDSTSYCASQCTFDGPCGETACAAVCLDNSDSTSYCASQCTFTTGMGEAACADVCIANDDSTSYCASQCHFETLEGSAACHRVCAANGDSESYCSSQCD